MNKALTNNNQDYYKYTVLFSAFGIELGLLLLIRDLLGPETIYNKDLSKTISYRDLEKKVTDNLDKIIAGSFSDLDEWNKKDKKRQSIISINKTILKKSITEGIIDKRNKLVHSEGKFDTSSLVEELWTSLLLLNIILPDNLKFYRILNEDNIHFINEKNDFAIIASKIIKEFVNYVESTDECGYPYYDTSDYNDNICSGCEYDSLLTFEFPGLVYVCPLCLTHGHFKECIQCGKLITPSNSRKWDDAGTCYVCDWCLDNLGR